MKFVKMEVLIDRGNFSSTSDWKRIYDQIKKAVSAIEWPKGSGSFTIRKQSGKKRGQGSGVTPIKREFMAQLEGFGWELEKRVDIASVSTPGPIDAVREVGDRLFAVEWETGNISSSHRAVNKMAVGLLKKQLTGGILILPTREFYQYLTDRVGNFRELAPYFPMWRALNIDDGFLAIIAVEHDYASADAPRIPKGTNGRAVV
ncbi:MAG: hypothetical protein HY788_08075 [Deltaproteobacteria bacterium]|nr:hypothetical protein [Deltaproteobacteria bacterium]